ncbi:MAG TPA: molybdopterin-dependent oxidoreductase [Candidatus Limnocylindria bacterium]|nr:molybdopterin-dependent oxidoreductase [Candidatus Limnocylindria bacterium]
MGMPLPLVQTGTVRGCCPLDCQDTCSWLAHVEDGRVVRVEGAKDHPITRGALCAKVNDYQERTYAPDRLLHPLRRIGAKGDGAFERVSWDDALQLIADRLETVSAVHGPAAILPINYLGSMGVVSRRALLRVFNALGASRSHGSVCGAAGNVLEAEGHPRGFDPEELVHARFVLMWGSNLLSTAHHAWAFIDQARKRNGARIVAIDPIRTRTAKACDEHISLRPGTDAVLAAGFANVMFREGLADVDFADGVTLDLDAYRAAVESWTPDRVAAATDVPADVIARLAREFAAARPAVIRCGIGPQQTVRGESIVRGLSALAIIGGHWRLPGGGLFIETGPVMDEGAAARPDLNPREVRSLDIARLGETLTSTTLQPPVKALVAWNMNPAVTQPDAGLVRAGLAREDLFTVVLEHFMTDTARYADVVLPSTTQLEHFDVVGSWGHQYISLNEPAVAPEGEALSHGEIARRLATRLGLTDPALHESDEAIAASALPAGVTLEMLRERGYRKSPAGRPGFPSKVRLADEITAPERPDDGRLQLLTPKSHWFLNSTFANMPRQRGQMGRPTLEVHPLDAEARGLAEGDEVEVRNHQASLRAWIKVTDALHPGVAALPGKWWGTATDSAAVANLLTPAAWAPHGQPAYNDIFVDILSVPARI